MHVDRYSTGGKSMKITKKRTLNLKNCYILGMTAIAFISIAGNFFQDRFYNKAIAVQQDTITELSNARTQTIDMMDRQ